MSDLAERLAQLTPEQRARLAARVSSARTADASLLPDDAIAIIGMGCRYPGGANSPDAFWELLRNGVDAVTPIPPDRWDGDAFFDPDVEAPGKIAAREGAFLRDVADFDADYFGIAPVEARQMDPQQRLFLEVAVEACESAGLTRAELAGSACGVFVGVHSHSSDYFLLQAASLASVDTHTSTGTAHSVLANRLSYVLDLRGPSMAIDTACSSSLVALHQACISLRARESTVAIAAGVNLMLAPDASVAFSKLRVLSPGARCRTFDASADGMARGEGCGVVVLKRARDAARDGDPILALVRGSAVNQDGATNGLTAPSTPSQIAVIRSALAVAQLEAHRVTFVETHGTGTALGDPIEVDAIAATYGAPRDNGDVVVLGALKTNIGHLEGAAGIAGVIKAVLCLRHRQIPKNLHFVTQNPLVRLDGTSIALANAFRDWTPISGSRVAGVSSFGFGGTNAHVILEEAPADQDGVRISAAAIDHSADSRPLLLSAHSAPALDALVSRWRTGLRAELAPVPLRDLTYTMALRRTHLAHRLAVTGTSTTAWADRLDSRARVGDRESLPPLMVGDRRRVAFVFCGQGPQWFAMGRELMSRDPVVRAVVEQVSAAVQRIAGWDLLAELQKDEATSRIHETEVTQPAIFALQMGLVARWREWGVIPDFVIGHSMGEIAAACTAGALDLDEGARIALLRGRAVSRAEGFGSMIALPISRADALHAIAGLEDHVGIAAVNAPASVVLAGDDASLASVITLLRQRGIEGRALEVRYASHSPQMEPLVDWLRDALGVVTHRMPVIPMYSSISHARVETAVLDAAHWGVGLRRSVDFSGGVAAALEAGCRAFVDIAPHPVMAGYVRECADASGTDVMTVASLRRNVGDSVQMLQSLAELYEAGVDANWGVVLPERARVVPVPSYPWQHVPYWIAAPAPRHSPHVIAEPLRALHGVRWVPAIAIEPQYAVHSRAYVLLGGPASLQVAFARRCRHEGIECRVVGDDDVRSAIDTASAIGADIIDLRALSARASLTLADTALRNVTALQGLLADVAARGDAHAGHVAVWCVTRGAQATVASERPDAAQAAVWGLGRVAAIETPLQWRGLVDLAPGADPALDVDDLLHALTQHVTEYESAYREGRRFVARLFATPSACGRVALNGDGYYLVTGGLGGVGLVVAEWLASQGAARIALLGRTAMPPRDRWDDEALSVEVRARVASIRAIEQHGALVWTASVDIGDRSALRRFSDERTAAGWGAIRGILHCAVAMQFALLEARDAAAIAGMLHGKISGAEALLDTFGADRPDFVVMFSSLAAFLGDRGQGAYAAANAALDAWTLAQRHDGVRVSAINWGAWLDTGLAASRGGALIDETLRARGVLPVSRTDATAALGAVIAGDIAMTAVFNIGTPEQAVPERDAWRILSDVHVAAPAKAAPLVRSVRDELLAIHDAKARVVRLTAIVNDIVSGTLGLDATPIEADRPLGSLGMDSLLAIRIRRRCERVFDLVLPATALFSYPTVAALSGLLSERLAPVADATPATVASIAAVASEHADDRSDADALAALRTRRAARRSVS